MFKLQEYYPVVCEVGFFETDIKTLVDTFTEWQKKIVNQLRFKSLAQQITKSNLLQNERIQKTYLWGQG